MSWNSSSGSSSSSLINKFPSFSNTIGFLASFFPFFLPAYVFAPPEVMLVSSDMVSLMDGAGIEDVGVVGECRDEGGLRGLNSLIPARVSTRKEGCDMKVEIVSV